MDSLEKQLTAIISFDELIGLRLIVGKKVCGYLLLCCFIGEYEFSWIKSLQLLD